MWIVNLSSFQRLLSLGKNESMKILSMNMDNHNVKKEFVINGGDKFDDYMFWLYPFYHELFPSLDELITIDTDIGKYMWCLP